MKPSFNAEDFFALSPLAWLLIAAMIILLLESLSSKIARKSAFIISLGSQIGSLVLIFFIPPTHHPLLKSWLTFDPLSDIFSVLFLSIGIAACFLAHSFFKRFEAAQGEFYFLLLSAVFGLVLIGQAADLLIIFLGIETLSIALYVLCGFTKEWKIASEASMKYFVMGAIAAGFLVYGIALIYGAVGSTSLDALLEGYSKSNQPALFLGGIAFITAGLAFKAALFPFHIWAPDVYGGSATPVTAFLAVGSKAGAFAALVRIFLVALPEFEFVWSVSAGAIVFLSLYYANFVAFRQNYLRPFFAYSGISQAGFMFIALSVGTKEAIASLLFYLVVYSLATVGSFAYLTFFEESYEGVTLQGLKGLIYKRPLSASLFSVCLVTLAGVPPTAGFFAKFYILKLAFEQGYYALVAVALIAAILSVAYYFRIIASMLEGPDEAKEAPKGYWPEALVGAICFAGIIFVSCFPAPVSYILTP